MPDVLRGSRQTARALKTVERAWGRLKPPPPPNPQIDRLSFEARLPQDLQAVEDALRRAKVPYLRIETSMTAVDRRGKSTEEERSIVLALHEPLAKIDESGRVSWEATTKAAGMRTYNQLRKILKGGRLAGQLGRPKVVEVAGHIDLPHAVDLTALTRLLGPRAMSDGEFVTVVDSEPTVQIGRQAIYGSARSGKRLDQAVSKAYRLSLGAR